MNKYKNLILAKFKVNDAAEGNFTCDSDMHKYLPSIGIDYHGTIYHKIVEEFKETGIVEQKGAGLVLKTLGRNHPGFEEAQELQITKANLNNFTIKLKDNILNILCNNIQAEAGLFKINTSQLAKSVNSDPRTVLAVLKQFQRNGLISGLMAHPTESHLTLMLDAVEFRDRGGFHMYEEIFKMTVEKLKLEVESLQNSSPDTAERMTALLANLTTIATFIYPS